MKLIQWQYYPKWHLSYKKSQYDYDGASWWEYYITVGPIQTRWWGKIWPKLKRSPYYSARLKEVLLDDLKAVQAVNVIADK